MAEAAFYDRVQVETSTTGTGSSVAVGSAVTGYLTPAEAGVQDSAVVNYVIEDGDDFEFQIGQTYSSSGPSLSRDTPSLSKISGTVGTSQIELSGSARVAIVPFAKQLNDMRTVVTPQMFGAVADGVTDDAAAINAAIAVVVAQGGGTVYVPPGTYKISSTIYVGYSDVRLIGAGRGDFHYTAPYYVSATTLTWAGTAGGTMVQFAPAGTQWISGNCFEGIYLRGNLVADTGISVYSSFGGRYIVAGDSFTTRLMITGCASGVTETADCMQNYIEVRGNQGVSGCGPLLQMTGISTANSCFNRIGYVDGNYYGNGIEIYNADNNIFEHIRLYRQPGGSGAGVILNGGAPNEEARGNIFIDCSPGAGGLLAIGTESATSASKENYILFYDTPNGAPLPSVGTGATLWYGTLDNKFPCASARSSTGNYGAGTSDVAFNSEMFDLMGNFSSPTFTAPKPGKYYVHWQLTHTGGVTVNDKWVIWIVTPNEQIGYIYYIAAARENTIASGAVVDLKAGQTVKLQIERADGSGNFPVSPDSRFTRLDVHYISQGL